MQLDTGKHAPQYYSGIPFLFLLHLYSLQRRAKTGQFLPWTVSDFEVPVKTPPNRWRSQTQLILNLADSAVTKGLWSWPTVSPWWCNNCLVQFSSDSQITLKDRETRSAVLFWCPFSPPPTPFKCVSEPMCLCGTCLQSTQGRRKQASLCYSGVSFLLLLHLLTSCCLENSCTRIYGFLWLVDNV